MRREHTVSPHTLAKGDLSSCALNAPEVERVVHLAGRSFVPDSWRKPVEFYQANVMGTLNVLEFCKRTKAPLVFFSSYVYGTPVRLPVDETHPVAANTPYNHSKLLAEDLCRFYAANHALDVTIFRPFNIYGPSQASAFLIPTILRQLLDPQVETIRVGTLTPRRDFLYVEDAVSAVVKALDHGGGGVSLYNLGSGISLSVEEIIQRAGAAAGISKPYEGLGEERPGEIPETLADIRKVADALGWSPVVSIDEGLRRTIGAWQ